MGVAFALLGPGDPRAIAALDHAGIPLDDTALSSRSASARLHSAVLRVVIRLKTRTSLDSACASTGRIELKDAEPDGSGRNLG